MQSKQYHIGADVIRVIGTLAVVATHVVTDLVMNTQIIGSPSWWYGNILDTILRPAVPLFIMLSGYLLLSPKDESVLDFFKKRFIKIAVPFSIWCGIYYAWDWYWWDKNITLEYILHSFINAKVYTHLYFIPLILGLYAITPLLRIFIKRSSKKTQIYVMCLFLLLGLVLNFINKWLPFLHTSFNAFTLFFPHIGYYLLGYYLKKNTFSISQQKIFAWILLMLTFITSLLSFWVIKMYWPHARWHYFYDNLSPNIMIISTLIFILLKDVDTYFTFSEKQISFIKHFSYLSFGIYFIHLIVINVLNRFIINQNKQAWFPITLKIILSSIISYILILIIKKIPILKSLV